MDTTVDTKEQKRLQITIISLQRMIFNCNKRIKEIQNEISMSKSLKTSERIKLEKKMAILNTGIAEKERRLMEAQERYSLLLSHKV